jgi:sterol desaturase/sphingolipid hydroxylase (fatty acid hydroxylase superfamily)
MVEKNMKLDTGMIVIIFVVALFYIRILMLRGKHRRDERKATLERIKAVEAQKSKSRRNQPPEKKNASQMDQPMFHVTSWWVIGPAVVLMLVGLAMWTTTWFPPEIKSYYWAPVAVGGILFIFGLK